MGRKIEEMEDPIRTEFMRDRDRIIHSEAFRRLKHKTQVFLSPSNDLFRTRLTHTLEVSQIARTISKALGLNEDLTEAIALGHDVGHTPFGHTGELVIREMADPDFKHSVQSVRVLQFLEKNQKGLNLTIEVLDGIENHSKTGKSKLYPENGKGLPITLEGQVVRVSDIIAYVNHDIQDAVLSGILKEEDLPSSIISILGGSHSERINTLVMDVVKNSLDHDKILMSEPILEAVESLRSYLFDHVYRHPQVNVEMDKAKNLLAELFHYLNGHMEVVYKGLNRLDYSTDEDEKRTLVDFVALITDTEAVKLYYQYFIPKTFFQINF